MTVTQGKEKSLGLEERRVWGLLWAHRVFSQRNGGSA